MLKPLLETQVPLTGFNPVTYFCSRWTVRSDTHKSLERVRSYHRGVMPTKPGAQGVVVHMPGLLPREPRSGNWGISGHF